MTISTTNFNIKEYFPTASYGNSGREVLLALIRQSNWKRIWVPELYYADIIDAIAKTGIEVVFYKDYPTNNDEAVISNLITEPGDVLLRINYFGLRGYRSEADIPIPVIEDQTSDLMGQWASNSNADYCLASLRRAYPLSSGAIVWSPKKRKIDSEYLDSTLPEELLRFDLPYWNVRKKYNWSILNQKLKGSLQILQPEKIYCLPFFLLILAQDQRDAERLRDSFKRLHIAIEPTLPLHPKASDTVRKFSNRMIQLTCDGRYSADEMTELAELISIFV